MDRDFLRELFAGFGAIDIKSMFGGLALSADGLTFALVIRDQLYLKTGPQDVRRFETEGCTPFQYEARGRDVTITSYWRMPERLLDEPDEIVEWAQAAFEAARRAALRKPKRKPRPRKA